MFYTLPGRTRRLAQLRPNIVDPVPLFPTADYPFPADAPDHIEGVLTICNTTSSAVTFGVYFDMFVEGASLSTASEAFYKGATLRANETLYVPVRFPFDRHDLATLSVESDTASALNFSLMGDW